MTRCFLMGLVLTAVICGGCGVPDAAKSGTFRPIDTQAAVFWDRQTTETAELLRGLVEEFNRGRTGLPVKAEHIGGYTEIYQKVSASIQARTLPSMAVGYESMTTEYVYAGAVLRLDDLVKDPRVGLSAEDLADFFPAVLETNRYAEFGGALYSFPFCKSVLMMYFNRRVLAEAGYQEPPRTWDEFLEQCRQIKAKTGKQAYAINVDCSTIDGMIFSMGGEVISGNQTLFDSPQAGRVFKLLEVLAQEELMFQIQPRTYDDEVALAQDRVAFVFRSSSGRTNVAGLMAPEQDKWGMALIPQGDPAAPGTVLYGPNICIFNTTPEQEAVAWEFIKFFTSREVTVRWALGTGYLPIRKSAAQDPRMQAFWAEWPYNRAAFDCLSFAKTEPNVAGWQEVRDLVEKAATAVLRGASTATEATVQLKQAADKVLQTQ